MHTPIRVRVRNCKAVENEAELQLYERKKKRERKRKINSIRKLAAAMHRFSSRDNKFFAETYSANGILSRQLLVCYVFFSFLFEYFFSCCAHFFSSEVIVFKPIEWQFSNTLCAQCMLNCFHRQIIRSKRINLSKKVQFFQSGRKILPLKQQG